MNTEIFDTFNLTVPIYDRIRISFDELKMIAQDETRVQATIDAIHEYMHERIHYTSGLAYHRVDDPMIDSFIVKADNKDSLTKVYLNPLDYFVTVQRVLNIPADKITYTYKDDSIIELLKQRISVLRNIKNFDSLKQEFPLLYQDYLAGKAKNEVYSKLLASELESDKALGETLRCEYERCCLGNLLFRFTNRQAMMYERYINNFSSILNICSRFEHHNKTNNYIYFDGVTPYKLKLLLCSKYIELALIKGDKETAQSIIPYLVTFLNDITNYTTKILVNDEEFGYKDVETFYKFFMKKFDIVPFVYPNVKYLYKTKEEVSEELEKELNIIKVDKLNRGIRRKIVNTGLTHGERHERDLTETRKLLEDKQKLFESTDYIEKFFTDQGYDGYIYFVYPNGIILREKYYADYKNNVPADDEAWYRSQIEHFFNIHNLNKQSLIRTRNEIVQRHYHTDGWQDTARAYTKKEIIIPEGTVEDFITKIRDEEILVPTINRKLF